MKNVLVTIKNHPIKVACGIIAVAAKNHPIKVACGIIAVAAFVGLFIKKPEKKEPVYIQGELNL